MRHGSLFSGIGGFDLAAEWMGWENVFHCEWNEFGQKVLKHYWPKAESYGDITKTDFTKWRGTVDIITGGFPCQPYSSAGKRRGKEDERHLWPEMLRAIREIKPIYIVGENVLGLTNWNGGMVFDEVYTDLEAEGYEVQAVVIPAAAKNAPHGRDRVWFVAHANSHGLKWGDRIYEQYTSEARINAQRYVESHFFTDTNSGGLERTKKVGRNSINVERKGEFRDVTNTGSERLERKRKSAELEGPRFGKYNAQSNRIAWQNFPTQSPVCGGDDGLPTKLDGITFPKWRVESVKAYGNAIVPQVAYEIFKSISRIH